MLAGAGGIDAVLFVVAADESVMPQTREHLDICHLLGVESGIFVVTKIDLVDREILPLVVDEIRSTARNTTLQDLPVVFVSNITGEGLDTLRAELEQLARRSAARATHKVARLPIDRVFTIRGFGTVVTGTLYSGQLHCDQQVEILPGPISSRIRGLQSYGRKAESVTEGQRTAVNLQGVNKDLLARGMTLTLPGSMRPTQCLDASLFLVSGAERALKNREVVRLHIGTQETLARVVLLRGDSLLPANSSLVQFRTQRPVCAWMGDRFIVRRVSPGYTIGGGEILNPAARKRRRKTRDASAAERLQDFQNVPRLRQWMLVEGYGSEHTLTSLSGYPGDYLLANLAKQSDVFALGTNPRFYCSNEFMHELSGNLFHLVDEFEKANPLAPGIRKEELRARLPSGLPGELFQHLLEKFRTERKLAFSGEFISVAGKQASLPAEDQRAMDQLEDMLKEGGVQPPSIKELLPKVTRDEKRARNILFLLQQRNVAAKIAEDFFMHREHLERIRQTLSEHFRPGSRFNVGQFKDLLGITRKHAIPLLEYFDRQRVTKRVGDLREVLK
jgi:selenocysteine-specific elongation factor